MEKAIAVKHLTNATGIAIFSIEDDYIETAYHNGTEYEEHSFNPVLYSKRGRVLFNVGKSKYFLDDFIRTDL